MKILMIIKRGFYANEILWFVQKIVYMEVNNGNKSDSIKRIEKQSNLKVMNLLW